MNINMPMIPGYYQMPYHPALQYHANDSRIWGGWGFGVGSPFGWGYGYPFMGGFGYPLMMGGPFFI